MLLNMPAVNTCLSCIYAISLPLEEANEYKILCSLSYEYSYLQDRTTLLLSHHYSIFI